LAVAKDSTLSSAFVHFINDSHDLPFTLVRQSSNSEQKSSHESSANPGKALITKSWPEMKLASRSLMAARARRFTKFLCTADPTVLATTNPNLGYGELVLEFK
jgi:hypothetical protein